MMMDAKMTVTTGLVAKVCNVSPQTVSKWVDTGLLEGYRLPSSKDRRITLASLVAFMQKHQMPLAGLRNLPGFKGGILILADDVDVAAITAKILGDYLGMKATVAGDAVTAAYMAATDVPSVVIVEMAIDSAVELVQVLREKPEFAAAICVGISPAPGIGQKPAGFNVIVPSKFSVNDLAFAIRNS